MKAAFIPSLVTALTLGFVAFPTDSQALIERLFASPPADAPQGEEKLRIDREAEARLAVAVELEQAGNRKAALKAYQQLVDDYPYAEAAPTAQFHVGDLLRQGGKLEDAFDALQKLVTDYRQSSRFEAAITAQFEIAEAAKAGQKVKFAGIPMKLSASEIIEMYETVLVNAPFGAMAPLASFSIAEINQDLGRNNEAILAYQRVVEDYPESPQARDAQFRIGQISNLVALRSEDVGSIREAQAAMQTFVIENPNAETASDARAILSNLSKRDIKKDMDIARFYEKTGKLQSAAIYYRDILEQADSEFHTEARERLRKLEPGLATESDATIEDQEGELEVHFERDADSEEKPGIFSRVINGIRVIPNAITGSVKKLGKTADKPAEDINPSDIQIVDEDAERNRSQSKGGKPHPSSANSSKKKTSANSIAADSQNHSHASKADLIKASPRYVGPRAPDLDKLLAKPEPRLSPPSEIVSPNGQPASLPTSSNEADNSLLPPAPKQDTENAVHVEETPLPPVPETSETDR